MLSKGIRIEHVSKMLGHTTIKHTQRYAKVLAQDVRDGFDNIAAQMITPKIKRKKK
jgi:site-specific recombinase XerD